MIVSSLNGGVPRGVWLVVIAENTQKALEWLAEAAINPDSEPGRRVMVTTANEVERNLGQGLTPLAIEIENGGLVGARRVPSVRQFYSMVPTLISLSKSAEQEASRS